MRWLVLLFTIARVLAAPFSTATYNLEFYIDAPALGKLPKTEESRRVVRQALRMLNADVVALQEVGTTNALLELRASLEREGLKYPYWEHVRGHDSNLHVAFLSKLPITARRPHNTESFLHAGRRFRVLRGFGEIDVELEGKRITLITAHLKSKRQTGEADQQELREQEALLLREKIDDFFRRSPGGRLVVLGDLNDGIASRSTRSILGRGKTKLFDTRPKESGEQSGNRAVVWTHYYAVEELFSRIDYILASPAMRSAFRAEKSRVLAFPEWGVGSDHRPVLASFELN